ncbi:MAG: mechanosensitive ion channel domain-containing protein, partial [bacterium]
MKNIIAGIVLFFDRPFRVGDMIQVGNVIGEVR